MIIHDVLQRSPACSVRRTGPVRDRFVSLEMFGKFLFTGIFTRVIECY